MVLAIFVCGKGLTVQAQDYQGNWQRQKNPQAVAEVLAYIYKIKRDREERKKASVALSPR